MTEPAALPCPHCLQPPTVVRLHDPDPQGWIVYCYYCSAEGRLVASAANQWAAVLAWNNLPRGPA